MHSGFRARFGGDPTEKSVSLKGSAFDRWLAGHAEPFMASVVLPK
jgi:hypothetical protein